MGGFAPEVTPSPPFHMASNSKDEDADDGDNDDGDASSTNEMFT